MISPEPGSLFPVRRPRTRPVTIVGLTLRSDWAVYSCPRRIMSWALADKQAGVPATQRPSACAGALLSLRAVSVWAARQRAGGVCGAVVWFAVCGSVVAHLLLRCCFCCSVVQSTTNVFTSLVAVKQSQGVRVRQLRVPYLDKGSSFYTTMTASIHWFTIG